MPRGCKSKSINIDIQIENIQNEIDKYEQKISALKDTLKKLQDKKQKEKMETLYTAMKTSGKSFDDVIKFLNDNHAKTQNDQ